MSEPRPQPRNLEEIEPDCVPDLAKVLCTEGIEGMRYATRYVTGSHRDQAPCIWRSRADEERKRAGWETWVRVEMEGIVAAVLHEAHWRWVGEAAIALEETSGFYGGSLG